MCRTVEEAMVMAVACMMTPTEQVSKPAAHPAKEGWQTVRGWRTGVGPAPPFGSPRTVRKKNGAMLRK
jgi:hypothetical protein